MTKPANFTPRSTAASPKSKITKTIKNKYRDLRRKDATRLHNFHRPLYTRKIEPAHGALIRALYDQGWTKRQIGRAFCLKHVLVSGIVDSYPSQPSHYVWQQFITYLRENVYDIYIDKPPYTSPYIKVFREYGIPPCLCEYDLGRGIKAYQYSIGMPAFLELLAKKHPEVLPSKKYEQIASIENRVKHTNVQSWIKELTTARTPPLPLYTMYRPAMSNLNRDTHLGTPGRKPTPNPGNDIPPEIRQLINPFIRMSASFAMDKYGVEFSDLRDMSIVKNRVAYVQNQDIFSRQSLTGLVRILITRHLHQCGYKTIPRTVDAVYRMICSPKTYERGDNILTANAIIMQHISIARSVADNGPNMEAQLLTKDLWQDLQNSTDYIIPSKGKFARKELRLGLIRAGVDISKIVVGGAQSYYDYLNEAVNIEACTNQVWHSKLGGTGMYGVHMSLTESEKP